MTSPSVNTWPRHSMSVGSRRLRGLTSDHDRRPRSDHCGRLDHPRADTLPVRPPARPGRSSRRSHGVRRPRRRSHDVDVPHVRSDDVRASAQHPLLGAGRSRCGEDEHRQVLDLAVIATAIREPRSGMRAALRQRRTTLENFEIGRVQTPRSHDEHHRQVDGDCDDQAGQGDMPPPMIIIHDHCERREQ